VLFVCCLIVVPLPPGENPFAVNNNNNNNNNKFYVSFLCRAQDQEKKHKGKQPGVLGFT
jgi:hypothetical protein